MTAIPPEAEATPQLDTISMGAVELFEGVAGIAIGDVLLTMWKTAALPERVSRVTVWTEALLRETPGTIAACQFLLPTASPPKRKARAEAKKGFRIVAPRARRLITVPLGNKIWRRLVRGIIRAGLLLTRQSKLVKVASNEEHAFELLAQVATPFSPTKGQLEKGLAALYSALEVVPLPRLTREEQ